jgi:hypothetical protein
VPTLRISTLRKFDKLLKRRFKNTFTCSSKSTYSFRGDINEQSQEESSESDEEVLSKVDDVLSSNNDYLDELHRVEE